MADEVSKTCFECQGEMFPIFIMDRAHGTGEPPQLAYRHPDDRRSFWTGRYATAGTVHSFLCEGCGRIALYGFLPEPEPEATNEIEET